MKRMCVVSVVIALLVPTVAMANWTDNFDSYALGTINGQGGWKGWDNYAPAAGIVTGAAYNSPLKSQQINGPADSVHEYSGYNTGHWTYSAMQFIPYTFTSGATYFILLNTYADGGASTVDRWSVQIAFNGLTGQIDADCGRNVATPPVHTPFTRGAWMPIRVEIYLTEDWTQVYYGNTLLDDPLVPDHATLGGGYRWTTGIFGTDTDGALNIGAVDLFANNASAVYYDDMNLTPEPASLVLLGLGMLLVIRRK